LSDAIYSRYRFERYYNFVATVDCVGCNLECIFCFTRDERKRENINSKEIKDGSWKDIMPLNIENNCFSRIENNIQTKNIFRRLSPASVFEGLIHLTKHCPTNHFRISGGEPTYYFDQLLEILKLFQEKKNHENGNFYFILETNGIILGKDPSRISKLEKFKEFLHVRISFKTPTKEKYQKLTRRSIENHKYPYYALKFCLKHGIGVHPVLMREFILPNELSIFKENLMKYTTDGKSPNFILKSLEFERLFLYDYILHRFKNSDDEEIQELVEGIDFDIN